MVDERITNRHVYIDGFYPTKHFYFPHKNVVKYIDMDKIPKFTQWKVEEPVERNIFSISSWVYWLAWPTLYNS